MMAISFFSCTSPTIEHEFENLCSVNESYLFSCCTEGFKQKKLSEYTQLLSYCNSICCKESLELKLKKKKHNNYVIPSCFPGFREH